MGKNRNARAALAALAAVAGTGYASGRTLVSFFTQLGGMSWAGIAVTSACFGLLTGLCAALANRTGAATFAEACRKTLPRPVCRLAGALHGLLLAAVAAVMLANAAKLGALALPLKRAALWGMGLALALAVLLNAGRRRALPAAGLAVWAAAVLFYGALALDGRPPRLNFRGDVALLLEGSVPATLLLALCYGALNACVAADAVVRLGPCLKPVGLGLACGAGLAAVLCLGNGALIRGGRALLAQALPGVLLAARWGLAGFWLCAGLGFCCSAVTLAAALGGLSGWIGRRSC